MLIESQTWFTHYLPISTGQVFDRFARPYNTSRVIDVGANVLNVTAYQEYSPLYLPVTFAAVYGLSFALATSVLVHTVLYHGPGILKRFKSDKGDDDDIHAKLMREYKEVPDWWYWLYLVIFAALSIATIYVRSACPCCID